MVFTEDLMSVYKTQLKYMSELPMALANKELKVYIQPKTMNDGHTVIGGEALIRWERVNCQMIFPNDFIPILEKSGAIVDLDFFVYKEIFAYIRNRLDKQLPVVPISMNVSRVHMRDKRFTKYVDELLEKYQLDPRYVEFELTESIYMDNMEPALELLEWCKERHIKISMDDFGNGYSSLNMLDRVPIDTMKIDRIFLRDQRLEESNKIILESIINMAKRLHITTVCEGVETEAQLNFLRSVGCDVIQGYFVAKPMTIPEFDRFMETHPVFQP
jgi:EAL domain-containing protein (putative c-di-GMP-specific phosphodiesterase class I)